MLQSSSSEGRAVRYLLFDLGDTLWTKNTRNWKALEAAGNQRASTLLAQFFPTPSSDPESGQKLREARGNAIMQALQAQNEISPCTPDIMRTACQQIGYPLPTDEQAIALFEALRMRLPESRKLDDDALSTLHTLKQRGYQIGIVTNRQEGGRLFFEDLSKLGLLEAIHPDHVIVSCDYGLRKPHPAIFRALLETMGASPAETIMIGDNIYADVVGAKRLKLQAIWKPPPERLQAFQQQYPDRPLQLNELADFVGRYEAKKYSLSSYNEIKPFMQPDAMIERVSELLHLLPETE